MKTDDNHNEWDFPFCECDGQEAPYGLSGFFCDECKRQIAVRDINPMCDSKQEER